MQWMFWAMTGVQVVVLLAALAWGIGLRNRIRHPAVVLVLVWAITGLVQQGWSVVMQNIIVHSPNASLRLQELSLVSSVLTLGTRLLMWAAVFWALWAVGRSPASASVRQDPPQNQG